MVYACADWPEDRSTFQVLESLVKPNSYVVTGNRLNPVYFQENPNFDTLVTTQKGCSLFKKYLF